MAFYLFFHITWIAKVVIIIKGTGRNLKWKKLKGINSKNKVGKI